MIYIGVDPVAFAIGSFTMRWYGVMVLLAIAFLVGWVLYFGKRTGLTKEFVVSAALWGIPFGVIGAKVVHVVDNLSYYMAHPADIANPGGLAIFGAILGGTLGLYIHCRLRRVPFAPLADLAAPGVILAQAIGRVGCTINGCCYGVSSSLPWAVTWTHPNTYAPLGVAVHPTQVYELLWDLLVFAILWMLLRWRLKPSGSLFAAYLALYSLGSFLIRFLRGDVPSFAAGLNEGQVISLMVFVVVSGFLVTQTRLSQQPTPARGERFLTNKQ